MEALRVKNQSCLLQREQEILADIYAFVSILQKHRKETFQHCGLGGSEIKPRVHASVKALLQSIEIGLSSLPAPSSPQIVPLPETPAVAATKWKKNRQQQVAKKSAYKAALNWIKEDGKWIEVKKDVLSTQQQASSSTIVDHTLSSSRQRIGDNGSKPECRKRRRRR
jgi:hypothetical protein